MWRVRPMRGARRVARRGRQVTAAPCWAYAWRRAACLRCYVPTPCNSSRAARAASVAREVAQAMAHAPLRPMPMPMPMARRPRCLRKPRLGRPRCKRRWRSSRPKRTGEHETAAPPGSSPGSQHSRSSSCRRRRTDPAGASRLAWPAPGSTRAGRPRPRGVGKKNQRRRGKKKGKSVIGCKGV